MKKITIFVLIALVVIVSITYYLNSQNLNFSPWQTQSPNPCCDNVEGKSDEEKARCAACMAYAEAGGNNIADECLRLVLCTIRNRVYYEGQDNICGCYIE